MAIRLVPVKCTGCGATLEVDMDKGAAECPNCGSKYFVEKPIDYYTKEIANWTKHAELCIGDEQYDGAEYYYRKIIEKDPHNASAYKNALFCVFCANPFATNAYDVLYARYMEKVDKRDNDLALLERYFDYKHAMQFADQAEKDRLAAVVKRIHEELNRRLEEAKKEKAYVEKREQEAKAKVDEYNARLAKWKDDELHMRMKDHDGLSDLFGFLLVFFVSYFILWPLTKSWIGSLIASAIIGIVLLIWSESAWLITAPFSAIFKSSKKAKLKQLEMEKPTISTSEYIYFFDDGRASVSRHWESGDKVKYLSKLLGISM